MSVTMRGFGFRMLAGLAVLGGFAVAAQAQLRQPNFGPRPPLIIRPPFPVIGATAVNPNPFIAPNLTLQQAAFNTAVMGNALRSIPFGFRPLPAFAPPILSTGPIFPPAFPSPGLSTLGGTLAADPWGASTGYGLSTAGGLGGSYANPFGGGGYYTPEQGYLYGQAALTSATADFYTKMMQARLTREEARRSAIETARAREKWMREYEEMRLGLQDYREKQLALDLRIARGDAPESSIVSGRALNDLLKAINAPGRSLNRGPTIPLEEDLISKIIVTGVGSKGNIGLLKDEGKLTWPAVLREDRFKETADKLSANLAEAFKRLKNRQPLEGGLLKDIDNNFRTLDTQLVGSAEELSPQQYIEARQYLNKVREGVRALNDRGVVNYFNNTWTARGRNVAELVENMGSTGLRFAPAAPGDESAYLALYQMLRAFDAGLQTASR